MKFGLRKKNKVFNWGGGYSGEHVKRHIPVFDLHRWALPLWGT